MCKKFLIMLTFVSFQFLYAESKQENPSQIQFKTEKLPYGQERHGMNFVDDEGELKNLASLVLVSTKQFSGLDSSFLANIDKSTLVPEVLELVYLISSVKSNLTPALEQVMMLGDLYVDPKCRGQGYAKQLMEKTCEEIFSTTQTRFIVLVPEPFEYEENRQKSLKGTLEYEEKKEQLIKLYRSLGFVPCQGDVYFMYLKKNESE